MFIDQVTISVASGSGGNGAVSFRREKYVPKGGPDGGNGGNGGNIIVRANVQLHTLLDQRYKRQYRAQNGVPGSGSLRDGKWGEDLVIQVPCGTLVRDAETGEILTDLTSNNDECIVARGGKGGKGNATFASATNQAPRFAEDGEPGEERILELELKLIADVGLVGLPNAGKSTLISVISAAKPKIADYPFTTLQPNLGIVSYREYQSFTVADIPGLIEGAHLGKGLGTQFLRHIERTRVLLILIDCQSQDYFKEFTVLRNELRSFSTELERKPYLVALSKMDTASPDVEERREEFVREIQMPVYQFSAVTNTGIQALLDLVWSNLTAVSNT